MNNVLAFIVGIGKYDQPGWNIPGPAANALAVAQLLLDKGVPESNVFLFVETETESEQQEQDRIRQEFPNLEIGGVDFDTLDSFWRQQLPSAGGLANRLLIHWSGHGVTDGEGVRHCIYRDYTTDGKTNRVLNLQDFLSHLHSEKYARFIEQICLADICGNYATSPIQPPPGRVPRRVRLDQLTWLASQEGEYAREDNGRGVFTKLTLGVLEQLSDWPDAVRFADLMENAISRSDQRPYRIRYKTQEGEGTHRSRRIGPTWRLPSGPVELVGRNVELGLLDNCWSDPLKHVVSIVAWGGAGKSALVAAWKQKQVSNQWKGIDRYFEWSFSFQGGTDQRGASADLFLSEALQFFEDPNPNEGTPEDRGDRLARLVVEYRTLLILDGLEALQDTDTRGLLNAQGAAVGTLLRGLADLPQQQEGLCIVTTRRSLRDLASYHGTTVEEPLEDLTPEAGARLLHAAGVRKAGQGEVEPNDEELRSASERVGGHALTLTVMGNYLREAWNGDILKWDRVDFERADKNTPDARAFLAIEAYEKWFQDPDQGEQGNRQLAVLRLLGLFDRPASRTQLDAVCRRSLPGLTDVLTDLDEEDWNLALNALSRHSLIERNTSGEEYVDTHPLVREYFASQVKQDSHESWVQAHTLLFEHLSENTEFQPETLSDLQPLYQAITHGCRGGLEQRTCQEIYIDRIVRGEYGRYSSIQLGAISANLGALANFFDKPWSKPSRRLNSRTSAWLMNEVAFHLMVSGRMEEALNCAKKAVAKVASLDDPAPELCYLDNQLNTELTLGDIAAAKKTGAAMNEVARRLTNRPMEMVAARCAQANALHQSGQTTDRVAELFNEAEQFWLNKQLSDQHETEDTAVAERAEKPCRLYGFAGFLHREFLLDEAARYAWRLAMKIPVADTSRVLAVCRRIIVEAEATGRFCKSKNRPIQKALDTLSEVRTLWYCCLLEGQMNSIGPGKLAELQQLISNAQADLHRSNQQFLVPPGLLTESWIAFHTGDKTQADALLDKAHRIAERGPMRLHLADTFLTRARLFRDRNALQKAEELICKTEYLRRTKELKDAKTALRTQHMTPE